MILAKVNSKNNEGKRKVESQQNINKRFLKERLRKRQTCWEGDQ
jgi:hypothetical protein